MDKQVCAVLFLIAFISLFSNFIEHGGLEFPLLKIIIEIIILLLLFILLLHKDIFSNGKLDKYQKKIEDFFTKK